MTPRYPKLWSLTSLVAATLGIIAAVAVTVVLTAGGGEPDTGQARIIAASEAFFEAYGDEDLPALTSVVCAPAMDDFPGFTAESTTRELRGVAEIVITGDTATASMVVAKADQPELAASLIPMNYVNEDGWKLCP